MEKSRKEKGLILFTLFTLLLVIIGATYAYFTAQRGTGGSANINVEAGTTDSLTFTKGTSITIDANSDNFKSGEPNQSGETEVSAHLVANNGNFTASETYNVYLNLIDNPFVYTRENSPELILQVIDPDGQPLETLEDEMIKHVSIEGVDDEEDPLVGFDITTATGIIPIKLSEEISAQPSDDENNGKADETWQIKIILINHDYDQQVNTGKTFNAQAIIMHGTLPNIKVETTNITNNSMKVIATIDNYEDTIDKVEFKINADEDNNWHQASNDNENTYSYTFNGLTESKKYEVRAKVSLDGAEVLKVIEESVTFKKTLADVCPSGGNLALCVISLYNKNNNYEDTKLYYHDGTIEEGDAGDLSYRYTGGDYALTKLAKQSYNSINDLIKLNCNGEPSIIGNNYCESNSKYTLSYNPDLNNLTNLKQTVNQALTDGYLTDNNIKNFVCFGDECKENKDNLYRIIGAFQVDGKYQIKLVKADVADKTLLGDTGDFASQIGVAYNTYLGNHSDWPRYYWNNTTKNNIWSESLLNTENLNKIYLENIGLWKELIDETNWQVGGLLLENGNEKDAHTAYENELGTAMTPLAYQAKVGLMYFSDYYYGAIKNNWHLPGFVNGDNYSLAAWENWLWIGDDEWFITRALNSEDYAAGNRTSGTADFEIVTNGGHGVRPTFYLNSNVTYVSGTGTSDDPLIIK